VFRSHGGDHSPSNLALTCDAHHQAVHAGKLTITGKAPDELRFVWHTDDAIRTDTRALLSAGEAQADVHANEIAADVHANETPADVHANETSANLQANDPAANLQANDPADDEHPNETRAHVGLNDTQAHVGPNVNRAPIEPQPPTKVGGPDEPTQRAAAITRRSKFEVAVLRNDLKKAFARMGIRPKEAARLVDHAFEQLGPDAEEEAFVREALKKYRTG
jgi:hypothetical protein